MGKDLSPRRILEQLVRELSRTLGELGDDVPVVGVSVAWAGGAGITIVMTVEAPARA